MKKILAILGLTIMFSGAVFAEDWDSAAAIKRVNTIGTKILTANNIQQPIEFKVSDQEDINAYANLEKEVYVYKGLLQYVDNDTELAAVISHEIGHILNGHCAKQGVLNTGIQVLANKASEKVNGTAVAVAQQLTVSKISRTDEFEADLTGVDIMSKAGYNPLAMISVLNKICGNYIDILQTHPSGEKRLMNIYNYVDYNNPNQIKKGFNSESYTKALAVITPNIQKRQKSERAMKKFEKEQQKLIAKKAKRAKKMQNSNTIWDGYFTALQLMAS